MRNDDDEINPFSREATTRQANREVTSQPSPQPVKPPPRRPRSRNMFACIIPIVIAVIAFPVICCGGMLWFGFSKMSEPADAAVVAMELDDEIVAKLGQPLERSAFGVNDYNFNNGEGNANVEMHVEGTKGTAKVSGKMKLFAGVWSPEDLTITCEDGTEFKLPR